MKDKLILLIITFATISCNLFAQTNSALSNFPLKADPARVGKALSQHLLETKHLLYFNKYIHYAEVCTWYGAFQFAQQTNDKKLIQLLKEKFDRLLEQENKLLPPANHVDYNMFGCLPLKLYEITKDESYLKLGLHYADTQWVLPEKHNAKEKEWAEKGYSWQTRLWIDDMYMITIVQKEAYNATGDTKYINRAAKEMAMYLDKLQEKNGLFYHAPDVPFYWGRGDGWFAVGMTEVLSVLPLDSPYRKRIMKGYLLMMKNLKKYTNKDGLWNQLIDKPDLWTETSGSAMFTYAMIKGIKEGWLKAKDYGPTARKAWIALCNYINNNNDVTEVCVGTGKKNSFEYYRDRPRIVGDYHGQAPFIWCATALLQ